MGGIYRFLGLDVGLIQAQMSPEQRRPAYAADITYGTNNEFGFDYLRDNMAMRLEHTVQRGHHFAIVDEVDSILIDEARTPLIISGMVQDSAKWYQTFARIAPQLTRDERLRGRGGEVPGRRDGVRRRQGGAAARTSTTSTTTRTRCSCTTSTTPCARRSSTSATSSTWCRAAR